MPNFLVLCVVHGGETLLGDSLEEKPVLVVLRLRKKEVCQLLIADDTATNSG